MTRASKHQRVFFFEEPTYHYDRPRLDIRIEGENTFIVNPFLPHGLSETDKTKILKRFLRQLIETYRIRRILAWYDQPTALKFSRDLASEFCVYDCINDLSGSHYVRRDFFMLERELLAKAHIVFTASRSLYDLKKSEHRHVHLSPDGVDAHHFAAARQRLPEPVEQVLMRGRRVGYMGAIDERIDFALLTRVADLRPHVHFILVGPVVKIDPGLLPLRSNIHYLGSRPYEKLPQYLAGWDVAMLPFATNDATKYCQPAKMLAYLAAGRRVVSTIVRGVAEPFGALGLAHMAHTAEGFAEAIDRQCEPFAYQDWLRKVDALVFGSTWDTLAEEMWREIELTYRARLLALRGSRNHHPARESRFPLKSQLCGQVIPFPLPTAPRKSGEKPVAGTFRDTPKP